MCGCGFVYAPVQTEAMELIARFPEALWDVLLFSLCGALGQLVIFYNIREFGSVASTTITVTRWVLGSVGFTVCRARRRPGYLCTCAPCATFAVCAY